MHASLSVLSSLAQLSVLFASTNAQNLDTNLAEISRRFGQISPYQDNAENAFGVDTVGLPDGCQVEQAHVLQRHAQRFPTGSLEDGTNDSRFSQKVNNFTAANADAKFTGPLAFLNTYANELGSGYLTGSGAATEFRLGASFWSRYGRLLYNGSIGQVAYNGSFTNGSARPKPVLRTTGQSRIENSLINWVLGFAGQSFQLTPSLDPIDVNEFFDYVIIPEGGTENNTLASYDSCFNDDLTLPGGLGDQAVFNYIPVYLQAATARVQKYAPSGFQFTVNDTYAMQSLCAYESAYFGVGMSSFCGLFTAEEWSGFEYTLDLEYYYDYSFGNPTGRAQGLGYLQELLARLTHQYITVSNSSVNSTIDNNPTDFPLNQPFYLDVSHDDIIISVLTALSMDYFHDSLNLTQYPPDPSRHFVLSKLTPFGGQLTTEVIGCSSANPAPATGVTNKYQYYATQYGYNAGNATNKFIRMRLNHGILPVSTLRGSQCDNNRPDGMCAMSDFLASQANAEALANYDYACFADYNTTLTSAQWYSGLDFDGTFNASVGSSS